MGLFLFFPLLVTTSLVPRLGVLGRVVIKGGTVLDLLVLVLILNFSFIFAKKRKKYYYYIIIKVYYYLVKRCFGKCFEKGL